MFLMRYVCLEVSEEGLRRDLAESSVTLTEWTDHLKEAGMTVQDGKDFIMPSEGSFETLWITDDPVRARELLERGIPVLGLVSFETEGRSFDGIAFLGYHLTEMEPDYLDRIFRRQKGLPWEILETERCLVRETVPSDAKAFYEIYAEPLVTQFMEDLPKDEAMFDAWLSEYAKHVYGFLGYGIWTVCLKATEVDAAQDVSVTEDKGVAEDSEKPWDKKGSEVVIGRAGLTVREGFENPELGFVIGKKWQGRGYAKEVCSAILNYAGDLGIERILAFAEMENEASKRLLRKLGFAKMDELILDGRRCIQFLADIKALGTAAPAWKRDGQF